MNDFTMSKIKMQFQNYRSSTLTHQSTMTLNINWMGNGSNRMLSIKVKQKESQIEVEMEQFESIVNRNVCSGTGVSGQVIYFIK